MQDFGGYRMCAGQEYQDFRGVYMGLEPAPPAPPDPKKKKTGQNPSEQKDPPPPPPPPTPFPLPKEAVTDPHFFYVEVFDGGPRLYEDLARKKMGLMNNWPNVPNRYRENASQKLKTGSE